MSRQKKRYLGKELPEPFNGPRTELVKNPAKEKIVTMGVRERRRIERLLSRVNDVGALEELLEVVERQLAAAKENAARPAMTEVMRWTGSVVQELVNCGKEECKKCQKGPSHGPYWFHYGAGQE